MQGKQTRGWGGGGGGGGLTQFVLFELMHNVPVNRARVMLGSCLHSMELLNF